MYFITCIELIIHVTVFIGLEDGLAMLVTRRSLMVSYLVDDVVFVIFCAKSASESMHKRLPHFA